MTVSETVVVGEALAVAVHAGVPVLLWGSPGSGKTSVVRALGEALGWPTEVVIGSIREPADFAGLPVVADGAVRMAPPSWSSCRSASWRWTRSTRPFAPNGPLPSRAAVGE